MQSYNKLFIKQLFFNTENSDEVRKSLCRDGLLSRYGTIFIGKKYLFSGNVVIFARDYRDINTFNYIIQN